MTKNLTAVKINRELKHRRFWPTDGNRKWDDLVFDAYERLFVYKCKLYELKLRLSNLFLEVKVLQKI